TGREREAEEQLALAVKAFRARQPAEALSLAYGLAALADVARRTGRSALGASLAQESLAILDHADDKKHPAHASADVRAGAALWSAGQAVPGEALMRGGLGALERFPGDGFRLADARYLLGDALSRNGRTGEGQPLLRAALAWRESHLGPQDPRTLAVR